MCLYASNTEYVTASGRRSGINYACALGRHNAGWKGSTGGRPYAYDHHPRQVVVNALWRRGLIASHSQRNDPVLVRSRSGSGQVWKDETAGPLLRRWHFFPRVERYD